jgi:3'-phosphoadenosine 5'-phosphosulfate (PAPS) 3'-phosphatase
MGYWDTVAGNSLLYELGGGFYDFNGEMIKYDISNGNRNMKDYFLICASKEKLNSFLEIKNKNSEFFKNKFMV